jgi:hypothetical protein
MKAFYELEIILPNTNFSLLARTLEIILYTLPTRLIGWKSFTSTTTVFSGIRETNVALKLF